jgi:hypothetical protein
MKTLLEEIKSSNLEAIGYDSDYPASGTLYIKFKGGGLYSYYPVKESTYKSFKKAKSKGKYFHKYIKENIKYKVRRIE